LIPSRQISNPLRSQLWIEVAEATTSSGIQRPIFTHQLRRFILYKPPNITSANLVALPYAGGSILTVRGERFDSLGRTDTQASSGGLKCRFLWCANYLRENTCKYTPFVSGDVINSTTAVCVSGKYFAGDPDCDKLVIPPLQTLVCDVSSLCDFLTCPRACAG
jgi:hypothetical protein